MRSAKQLRRLHLTSDLNRGCHGLPAFAEAAAGQAQIGQLPRLSLRVKLENMSLAEIKTAIERLSFEERAELAAWLHGWKDDEWDEQMKRDIAAGKLDTVLHEVEDDIKAGRLR